MDTTIVPEPSAGTNDLPLDDNGHSLAHALPAIGVRGEVSITAKDQSHVVSRFKPQRLAGGGVDRENDREVAVGFQIVVSPKDVTAIHVSK